MLNDLRFYDCIVYMKRNVYSDLIDKIGNDDRFYIAFDRIVHSLSRTIDVFKIYPSMNRYSSKRYCVYTHNMKYGNKQVGKIVIYRDRHRLENTDELKLSIFSVEIYLSSKVLKFDILHDKLELLETRHKLARLTELARQVVDVSNIEKM